MKKTFLSRLNPRLKWRGIRGFCYNEKGISAVEFALIAPFMALLFFGAIELSFLMRADRRVTSTAASLGDLTTRLAAVTDTDMVEMFQAARVMMSPLDANASRMRLTSIVADSNGNTTVGWSDAYNMTPLTPGAPISVPAGIVSANGSVVLSEVEYDYTSTIGYFLSTDKTLTDRFYLRPRRVNILPRLDDGDPTTGFGT